MRISQHRKLLALLLLPALALGPIGCGAEAIPVIISACVVVGTIAFTIHEVQEVESAYLDTQMKRLRLQGMKNGMPVTIERELNNDQLRGITSAAKVNVNGQDINVSAR